MLLAIETSCDETSVALFDSDSYLKEEKNLKSSLLDHIILSQISAHQPYGGVVPELAAREHMLTLPKVCFEMLKANNVSFSDLKSTSVTTGPGLKGCLLVGLSFAKGLSVSRGIELNSINHLEGHILSFLLENEDAEFPALVLLASGGHTELVLVNAIGDYQILARTMDDAAGEAFDKIGVLLGISYPGGRILSEYASKVLTEDEIIFPQGVFSEKDKFSFSGLKTSVFRLIETRGGAKKIINDQDLLHRIAHAAEKAIVLSLIDKMTFWSKSLKPKSLSIVGGVAANSYLREKVKNLSLELGIPVFIPSNEYCTDNAAMIGAACLLRKKYNLISFEEEVSVRARWPVEEINKNLK